MALDRGRRDRSTGSTWPRNSAELPLTRPVIFVPGGVRENSPGGKAGHADQEVQARADRDDAAADRSKHRERKLTPTRSGHIRRWATGRRHRRPSCQRGMEIWKTLRVSHIPTPPATTDKCLTRPLVAQSGFNVGPGECHAIKSRRHCEDDLTFF